MAFKNKLLPNPSLGGDFSFNTSGTGNSGGSTHTAIYDNSVRYEGVGSFKKTKTGSSTRANYYLASRLPLPFPVNSQICISQYVLSNTSSTSGQRGVIFFADEVGQVGTNYYGTAMKCDNWTRLYVSTIVPAGALYIYAGVNHYVDLGESVWIDKAQLEAGSTPTSWEFPGIDLTSQAIPGQEHVNNLSLETILKLTATQSSEWVNNLILENILKTLGINSSEFVTDLKLETILQLSELSSEEYVNNLLLQNVLDFTGIPSAEAVNNLILENVIKCLGLKSMEDVNNLDFIYELVLTGIETCETFGELIIFIYYNLIRTDVTITHPELLVNACKPSSILNIKHPSIRRLS